MKRFQHTGLQIEVTQVAIHEADEPDVVVNFPDADRLASKDGTEVDLFAPQTDPAAIGEDEDAITER